MRHYSEQEWMGYVRRKLSQEERQEYEHHLYTCDVCLELYMKCVTQANELESLTNVNEGAYLAEAWIEQVVAKIHLQKKASQAQPNPPKIALYRRPWFQYTVAAAITMILMTTGMLRGITADIGKAQADTHQSVETSYTDKLMDKTVAMLDAIQPKPIIKNKGGSNE
jgi:anti-sigma factor RsiW